MSKRQEMQRLIRAFKDETGETEVDMHKVAAFAAVRGWPLPAPKSPLDLLAKQFADAAREEIRYDQKTGRPYRANHAIPVQQGQQSLFLWIDIDEAPRKPMLKSAVNRREQMIGDGLQLSLDLEHWNSLHPEEEAIVLDMDLSLDIEWRKNAPAKGEAA